jgi:hypothetical protein
MSESTTVLVCNTKGGVGKTIVSTMVLPYVLDPAAETTLRVYELDDNNRTPIENSAIAFETFRVSDQEKIDGLAFDLLTEEGINIIDAGGGSDTLAVLDHIRSLQIPMEEYYVPINDDIEQVDNALETIERIRKTDPDAKISMVLNRCHRIDEDAIKEQFVGIFGSEFYGVDSRLDEFGEVDFLFVPNSPLFPLLKMRGTTLRDFYPVAVDLIGNFPKYRAEWIKEGKDIFKDGLKQYRLAVAGKEIALLLENYAKKE